MTVLIAPDKFKGSLTASEVCSAVHNAIVEVDPTVRIVELPLADGGEGTCELLTSFSHGTFVDLQVRDPLFRNITSGYGISRDGNTAFMEMAKASGLQLLSATERNPMATSTVGTGDIIRHALDNSVGHIIMGIGGSATNDAGMGMATALGIMFYDKDGNKLEGRGNELNRIRTLDHSKAHPKLSTARFTIFCDVDNPLHGPHGAAHVFAPQKGANEQMVLQLDEGLRNFQKVVETHVGTNIDFPGAGAGGGLPAALKAFTNVKVRGGMDFIIEFIGLEKQVRQADIIITGEGKIDEQTLSGKVVKGVADLASRHKKILLVIAGSSGLNEAHQRSLSITRLITLVNSSTTEVQAMESAYRLVGERIKDAWKDPRLSG